MRLLFVLGGVTLFGIGMSFSGMMFYDYVRYKRDVESVKGTVSIVMSFVGVISIVLGLL